MHFAVQNDPATTPGVRGVVKCPTGVDGLDQITDGGLPRGRPTLVCGAAGCGKTLLGIEFIVKGITQYGEPGVIMAFEEAAEELAQNVASLGFDLQDLEARGLLVVDHVRVERSEIEETGEYDLEGLFIRLSYAIDSVGAKRVLLDTIESLFSGLGNAAILRAELRRLFGWLKAKGVTAIITGERGEGALTRQGLEEYVSDCVILLDNRVTGQISTRRLRIVKYRGSAHGTNEYPFLINRDGLSVLPITSLGLDHPASNERVSTGVSRLDEMLGGQGLFRGSSVLISGTAGTGKSSLAARISEAACQRGEMCLYFAFEESREQFFRNSRSVGVELQPWHERGSLHFYAARPSTYGLEMHLASMHRRIEEHKPQVVVMDPLSNLIAAGSNDEVRALLTRLVDFLKSCQITTVFTHLSTRSGAEEGTEFGISSIMDTWLLLRDIELGGERNRGLYVLKSRGMAHSNQIREFVLSDQGIQLLDVYLGPTGVLTGSLRIAQEARDRAADLDQRHAAEKRRAQSETKRRMLEAQIAALKAELDAETDALQTAVVEESLRREEHERLHAALASSRREALSGAGLPAADPEEVTE